MSHSSPDPLPKGSDSPASLRSRIIDGVNAIPFWQIAVGYLVFLTAAEVLTALYEARLGMIAHGLLLVAVFFLAATLRDAQHAAFLYAMALAPLIRLTSLSMPLISFDQVYWYAIVGLPLILAALAAMRITGIKPAAAGLALHKPFLQLLIALTGLGLGAVEYLILRPKPLADAFSIQQVLLPAMILLIFTGFLEELIFRGVMQHSAIRNFRWWGLIYVSLVFAVLHIGYEDAWDVVFVFLVAMFFALMTLFTRSIVGVTIAHGLTNIGLFLIFPFILGPLVQPRQADSNTSQRPRPTLVIPTVVVPTTILSSPTSTVRGGLLAGVYTPMPSPTPGPTQTGLLAPPTATTLNEPAASPGATERPLPSLTSLLPSPTPTRAPTLLAPISTTRPTATSSPPASPTALPLLPTGPPGQSNSPRPGMVFISAGAFRMGCDPASAGSNCAADQGPLHEVLLSGYWIDRSEVTNAQYAACVTAGACRPPVSPASASHPDYYTNPDYASYPVVNVSWEDAQAYCRWSDKRLPTEAEWEKAARGEQDTRLFPWGNEAPLCARANFRAEQGFCWQDTSPVGAFPLGASPFDLLDLAGNVAEWVADWYDAAFYTVSPTTDPAGPAQAGQPALKVVRGGGWADPLDFLQVFQRQKYSPTSASPMIGFRCAATP